MFDLEQELKNLPELPGVYIMKDKNDCIIYVGKAVILKNRVRQYFRSIDKHLPKVRAMVENVASFEYIVTDTEFEALMLECNLIKLHKPFYNILLKDDKGYPYIKVTLGEEYPRLFMTRRVDKDKAKYFGPYYSMYTVNCILESIEKIFPVKTCSKKLPKEVGKSRPCLNYFIGRCLAPCQGGVNSEQYNEMMLKICDFLAGKTDEIQKEYEEQMRIASENLDFEKAAVLRDRLIVLDKMTRKQKITTKSDEDIDIIGIAKNEVDACIQIFFVRSGKILGRDYFILEGAGDNEDNLILEAFIKQFYDGVEYCPHKILLPVPPVDIELLEKMLSQKRGSKVEIKIPQKGEKHELLKMVEANANISLHNYAVKWKGVTEKNLKILEKLADVLHMDKMPSRIESYDVSNTGTQENVASMVVFENGKPNKNQYKRFKIKEQEWSGDLNSMEEVLERRFNHREFALPDLILVDGGIQHVNMAKDVIEGFDYLKDKNIAVFGMVKDDKHRSRGLINENGEIELKSDLELLRFITAIQNETHRFAIEYNKKLRDKRYKMSALDNIEGIGKVKKVNLLRAFGSVANIKKSTKEELMLVKGISEINAIKIIEHFKEKS